MRHLIEPIMHLSECVRQKGWSAQSDGNDQATQPSTRQRPVCGQRKECREMMEQTGFKSRATFYKYVVNSSE